MISRKMIFFMEFFIIKEKRIAANDAWVLDRKTKTICFMELIRKIIKQKQANGQKLLYHCR